MKYVFLVAFQKGNKNLVKVRTPDAKEVWATTTEAVYKYAKEHCKKDAEYEMQTTEKNGQLHISLVGNAETLAQAATHTSAPATSAPVSAPVAEKKPYEPYQKSASTNESIVKQSTMKAAADAVATAMQGQIGDIDTLGDMIIKLYEKLYSKVS